jgi:hypothetical protein
VRLENCKSDLIKITLDDLYNDEKIVGSTMKQDYQPQLESGVSNAMRAMRVSFARRSDSSQPEEDVANQQLEEAS